VFYAAFGCPALGWVEFLTGVWHYSALRTGLALCVGPLLVLPFARAVAPRLATRLGGPGPVAVLGLGLGIGAQLVWLAGIRAQPAFLSHLLPALLLGGPGVGLTVPSLLGAGTSSRPPARFGTGSGVLNTARQVGSAIGVAVLVAILTSSNHAQPVDPFRAAIWLAIAFYATAAAVAAALPGSGRRWHRNRKDAAVSGPRAYHSSLTESASPLARSDRRTQERIEPEL
jgi:hypothetical protein